jgi:hypothetical protein
MAIRPDRKSGAGSQQPVRQPRLLFHPGIKNNIVSSGVSSAVFLLIHGARFHSSRKE